MRFLGIEYSMQELTFGELEVGSVFRFNGKTWQKVTSMSARDLQPPAPTQFETNTQVESIYEHKSEEQNEAS